MDSEAAVSHASGERGAGPVILGHGVTSEKPVQWDVSIRGNPHLMVVGRPGMGKTALAWLHQNYSATGEEGDIRISDDSMQKDGSERLVWESKSGDYSGISFFEIRKPTAMLMFTVVWDNDFEDQYLDTLNSVIDSYRIP